MVQVVRWNYFVIMSIRSLSLLGAGAIVLVACNEPCPRYAADCADDAASPTSPVVSVEREPGRYGTTLETPEGLSITAHTGEIARFVGSDSFKLVVATSKHLYLLLPDGDTSKAPRCVRIDRGDEGINGAAGWPNEPLFSPDGRYVAYAGTFPSAKTDAFVREASEGTSWRVPLVRSEGATAHPHWYRDGDSLWLYVSDVATTTNWDGAKNNGTTWRALFHDSAVGTFTTATLQGRTLPGAFKGGISRDGKWAATSYQQSVLWNASTGTGILLNGGVQQCNPSINPFNTGSNTDYMMILGFGGSVPTPTGSVSEGQHENLWIWSKDDNAVWRAALPNAAGSTDEVPGIAYVQWQRPEWSTHPDFATALAKRNGTGDGIGYDLFVVKLGESGGELASHDRRTMLERGPVLRIATGSLISSDWSHLWVKP